MKRKTLTLVLCLLATFALASIGFASWIIANPDIEHTITEGQFEVYEADLQEMSATITFDNSSFIFGKPKGYVAKANDWLIAGTDVKEEKLTVNMTVNITNADYLNGGTVDLIIFVENDNIISAIEGDLLTCEVNDATPVFESKTVNVNGEEKSVYAITTTLTPTVSDKTGTATLKFEFGWGSKFGTKNPYTYYSGKAFDGKETGSATTYPVDAETNLNALHGYVTGLKFGVTIIKTPSA